MMKEEVSDRLVGQQHAKKNVQENVHKLQESPQTQV